MTEIDTGPALFQVRAETFIAKTPEFVYSLVSDLQRCGQWSEECMGGEWTQGEPGAVGSVFRGRNSRRSDVVPWAPVVRGSWETEAEVVAAEPGRQFRWAMRNSAGRAQESVWGFDIMPANGGSSLTHNFRMNSPTEGIQKITAGMTGEEKKRFFAEWTAKLEKEMTEAVERIKDIAES